MRGLNLSCLFGMTLMSTLFLIISGLYRRKMSKKTKESRLQHETSQLMEETRLAQLILSERERIARELHDDIGSTLTSIRIAAELLDTEKKTTKESTNRIRTLTNDLYQQVNTIIWCLNNQNGTISGLFAYISKYAKSFLSQGGIHVRTTITQDFKDLVISGEKRKAIFLIVKEILNNILKHAQAQSVSIDFSYVNQMISITIEDDGIGFDLKQKETDSGSQNGIKNIQLQIRNLNGNVSWQFRPGTRVIFSIPIAEEEDAISYHKEHYSR